VWIRFIPEVAVLNLVVIGKSVPLLAHVARQIQVDPSAWTAYAALDETWREHG
jgi:hypothetical protein